tara:strand:- start:5477 stop:6622 length:1146 start_codon:yes stop_codon:yes gene_type:complete
MVYKLTINSFIFCLISLSSFASAEMHESNQHNFRTEIITNKLEYPWAVDFLPSGEILVTEKKSKRLRIVRNGQLDSKPIKGLPANIDSDGQGGLLDILVHPNYALNKTIFLSYSGFGKGGKGTEVVRAKLQGYKLIHLDKIFTVEPKTKGSHHYGSRMDFAADGTLFITVGDRYHQMDESQNPDNHMGTVLRINEDGSIPADNPFVNHKTHKPEIYSYGHRNGQGIAWRSSNNTMWMHEHGPRGGDELNILDKPGANYGWPAITYGIDYSGAIISDKTSAQGMEQPVVYWVPSIAPCGMTFYTGEKFLNWKDNLFIGALRGSHIRRLVLKDNRVIEQEVLLKNYGRIRDVISGPDGFLYFITDAVNGQLVRITPFITKNKK